MRKLVFSLFVLVFVFSSQAHEFKSEQFHVEHPWARPTFALATTAAAYLSVHNIGKRSDRLTSVSVDADIADEAQLHDVLMEGDVMKMRQITDGVTLDVDEMVSFTPGGKHIMLLGLKGPLNEGDSFLLTLNFESGGAMQVKVNVEQPKQEQKEHSHHH